MRMRQKKIFEAGTTNPVRHSTKVRDTQKTGGPAPDRGVNYEEPLAIGNYAIRETSVLIFTNKIISGPAETPINTITGR